ncbi:MAG: helix-turn-helix transcriptional regulator, partial [Firmicutes bacterium]|nr:helix-turn-helix transcriptional regulator [Bacillota bacterium]
RYIAEHYAEDVTVRDVAAHLQVSESYLMHLLRENVGLTFNECLTAYRMMMAKKMLREGKYRVYEIAERVGYSDPKDFSQVFRKHTGLLPSQYRG